MIEEFLQIKPEQKIEEFGKEIERLNAKIKEKDQELELAYENIEKYKILLDHSSDPIFSFNKHGEYLYVNNAFALPFGKTPSQITGKKIWDIFSKEEADYRFSAILEVFRTGEIKIIQVRVPQKDRDKFYITSIKPIKDTKGNVKSVIAISKEISERIYAEEKLQQYAKNLEELNATKDRLFTIIAHDLKNPFNALLNFSDLLLDEHDFSQTEETIRIIKIINSVAKQGFSLLENLLSWSLLQTGRLSFKPDLFDLNKIIYETVELFENTSKAKKIDILINIPAYFYAYVDKIMVITILKNLISNAIKFTQPEGKIIITARNNNGQTYVITQDTGVGISPEIIPYLFRIDKNYTTNGTDGEKGSGLGLIICHEFVEKHQGTLTVESELGKGSKFIVTIPNQNRMDCD